MIKTDIDVLLESYNNISTDEFQQPQKQSGFIKTDNDDTEDKNERRNDSL
jgi:hypothetical protein